MIYFITDYTKNNHIDFEYMPIEHKLKIVKIHYNLVIFIPLLIQKLLVAKILL